MQPLTLSSTARKLLEVLRRSKDVISGEYVCELLGVSRAAVWKQVGRLQSLGYEIEPVPRRGYRLISSPDLPASWEVEPYLQTLRFGRPLLYYPTVSSTNDKAMELARKGAGEGTVVSTDHQTTGRGRLGRPWYSPPGKNLCFSMILRPDVPPAEAAQIILLASLALAATLENVVPETHPRVKWPNDLFIGGKKVAGLLCEMLAEPAHINVVILGIGVNVNVPADAFPESIAGTATSLAAEAGRTISRPRVLAEFLNTWEEFYWHRWRRDGLHSFMNEWRKRSLLLGRFVRVYCGHEVHGGIVVGLSERGGLKLRTADGKEHEILAGEARIGSDRLSREIREESDHSAAE